MIELSSNKEPRILIIRGGAIGDFILTLPVLSALKLRFPKVALEILGYPRIASLALDGGLVKAVHPIESPELAMFFSKHAFVFSPACIANKRLATRRMRFSFEFKKINEGSPKCKQSC